MAKNIEALIPDTRNDLLLIEKELQEFRATRDELNRQLANARKRQDRKESPDVGTRLADGIIKELKKEAKAILIQAIEDATEKSVEFNNDTYKYYLFLAAQEDTIYKITRVGSGWDSNVDVMIDYASEAGTLADYARGINVERNYLKVKQGAEGSNRGLKATNWWNTNIYGTERQDNTINNRIGNSGKTAPFWQLLNNGTTALPSDRKDGSYVVFPQQPTDFIGKAEETVKAQFLEGFAVLAAEWRTEIQELAIFINDIKSKRDAISNSINNLKVEAKQDRAIFESFKELKDFVDRDKLGQALKKYRAGEEFERAYISKTGAGRKLYLTRKRVEGLI